MKLFGIWGQDCIYGGLHGMNGHEVIEAEFMEAALDEARTLAAEMDCIEPYSDKYWEIYEEIFAGDLEYGAFEVNLNKVPTLDIKILDKMYYEDPEGFEEKYKKQDC